MENSLEKSKDEPFLLCLVGENLDLWVELENSISLVSLSLISLLAMIDVASQRKSYFLHEAKIA
jgi:hypothetical protein